MEQVYIEIVEYLYKQLEKLSSDDNAEKERAEIQKRINDIEDLLRAKYAPTTFVSIRRIGNLDSSSEHEDHDLANTSSLSRK
jgi:hypothetical protein